jgi:hypothetical protein
VTATIRGPVTDTLRWVRYHRSIGVDHVTVVLDDPADPAFDLLSEIEGVLPVRGDSGHRARTGVAADAPIEARLHANAEFGFRIARDRGCAWSIALDGDELLDTRDGLRETLERFPDDELVARFPVLEAVPDRLEHDDPFVQVHTFRRLRSRHRGRLAVALGCGDAFFAGEYLRGHRSGKSAVRTSADVVSMRSHVPVFASGPGRGRTLERAWLLHYDCTSLAGFRRKWSWRRDSSATAVALRPARQAQGDAFARIAGDAAAEERLFRRLYFLTTRQRITLRAVGMLASVSLDPGLFGE